ARVSIAIPLVGVRCVAARCTSGPGSVRVLFDRRRTRQRTLQGWRTNGYTEADIHDTLHQREDRRIRDLAPMRNRVCWPEAILLHGGTRPRLASERHQSVLMVYVDDPVINCLHGSDQEMPVNVEVFH